MSLVNVHAKYGNLTQIFTCKPSEFVPKVAQHFNIEENEIEIYDRTTLKRIAVENITSVMKVEVKRKSGNQRDSGSSTSREEPNPHAKTILKLKQNTILTGLERSFLVDLLSNIGSSSRKNSVDNIKTKRNVKIQVDSRNIIPQRSIECQTDKIITETPAKRRVESNNVMYQSKRLAVSEKIDPAKAKELMDKLYDERRSFILTQLPLANFVKEKYPLLFSLAEVRNEIDRILHHGKCEQFLSNIDKYSKYILSLVREDDPLLLTTKRKIASFTTVVQKKYALQVGSLLMLSSIMNEERGYLKLIDQHIEPSILPYIEAGAKLEDIFSNEYSFRVYIENIVLCTASNFLEALLCLMGCFFIFNVVYPNISWDTFVAFERLYLGVIETQEARDHVCQIVQTLQLLAVYKTSIQDPLKS